MRLYRLSAPAAAFALLGLLLLLLGPLPYFMLRGGLASIGGYTIALQIVLSLFLISFIDDFQDQESRRGRSVATLDPVDTAFDFRRALLHFYLRKPFASLFLAFGIAVSLTTVAIGVLDYPLGPWRIPTAEVYPSELTLGVITLLTTFVQLRTGGYGFFGWCLGLAAGCAFGQTELAPTVDVRPTLILWSGFGLGVGVAGLLIRFTVQFLRRRRERYDNHA